MSKKDKDVLKAFAKLDKINPEATFLSESTLSNVDDYIDTGCMVLNAIISGSLHKGVPKGRITGFSGQGDVITDFASITHVNILAVPLDNKSVYFEVSIL